MIKFARSAPRAITAASTAIVTAPRSAVITPAATKTAAAFAPWRATARAAIVLLRLLDRPTFEHGLARQADLPLLVDAGDHHHHFVAHLHDIADIIDRVIGQLRFVHHPIHARRDFYKRAEIGDAHDFAC